MRQGDSLKSYFFQNQLTNVSNYGEEVSSLAFISGLQVTLSLYKHLLKQHNITKMSKVLSRSQPYILEEVMKASSNHSAEPGDGGAKPNSPHEAPDHAQDRLREQPTHKGQALPILPTNPL